MRWFSDPTVFAMWCLVAALLIIGAAVAFFTITGGGR